nr:hypothetical protein EgrG_002028400 [Echinococcus granulosus]
MRGSDLHAQPPDMLNYAFQCFLLLLALLRIAVIPTNRFIINVSQPLRFVFSIFNYCIAGIICLNRLSILRRALL